MRRLFYLFAKISEIYALGGFSQVAVFARQSKHFGMVTAPTAIVTQAIANNFLILRSILFSPLVEFRGRLIICTRVLTSTAIERFKIIFWILLNVLCDRPLYSALR